MLEIAKLIGDAGEIRKAGGNRPFLLDRADRLWAVESGHVDVFSVRLEEGRPSGARQSFFTVPAGDILLGAGASGDAPGRGILAVGVFGTVLREIDASSFLRLGESPSKADDVERLLRRWIRNVSMAVGGKEVAPRDSRDLGGEGRISLAAGEALHPTWKTIWVRIESGRAAFMGRREFPELRPGLAFPLVKGAWLRILEGTVLSYREEWPSRAGNALGQALEGFSGFTLGCAAANAVRAEERERARIARREEAQRSMRSRGISRLASIFQSSKSPIAAVTSSREPLLAACRMVGQSAGIEVRESVAGLSEPDEGESLDEIRRASGFRTRQVLLRGDWWRRDNGPLLAFREEDGRPMAAIPSTRRSYELHDPVDGTTSSLDRAGAASLACEAHVFYRPLPNVRLGGRDLLRLAIRGCGRDIRTALAVGLGAALLSLLVPSMTGRLFDTIIPEADGTGLLLLAAILVAGALATFAFDIAKGIALLRAEGRMDGSAQAALWDRLLSLPAAFFGGYAAGDLAARGMGISAIRTSLSDAAASSILASLLSLANLWLLFGYSPSLAWAAIGLSALGLAFILGASLLLVRGQSRVVELEGKSQGIVLQLMTGIAKLRISGAEEGAFALWAETFAEKERQAFRSGKIEGAFSSFYAVYPLLALMGILMWLVWRLEGGMSAGRFIAFSAAFATLQNAMLRMGEAVVDSLCVIPIYNRLRPIVETLPEADDRKEKAGALSGRIEIDRLTYRYHADGPAVLKDVSLKVEPGEFVAIVGGSGSGKSTLLRMLLGFARPEAGAVYYDGRDLASLDLHSVRRQIGVVLQNGQIMAGDIRKTILGSSRLTEEDAWEAARMVGLDRDIREMPMGMYTQLPAGGGTLSGGQRQRLIIARAIVRKPRILFFDEATSALDNRTQAIVGQSLEGLQVSRIVIAHRLSTIAKADRIYVLDKGGIAEQGSYEELMEAGGLFAELSRRQIA